MSANACPCGRDAAYETCCGPYHQGAAAPTAESLMRARYSAYVRGEIDYILATHQSPKDDTVDREATEKWSKEAEWLGLEVVATEAGGPDDKTGMVEFIAKYRAGGNEHRHHERSRFGRVDGKWMYVDGDAVKPAPVRREADKVGRNDLCPCGSGKKYKRCHG